MLVLLAYLIESARISWLTLKANTA